MRAARLQRAAQLEKIFDNAVVHKHYALARAKVRVGVALRGFAVRGPARMPNAGAALQRLGAHKRLQPFQFARFTPHRDGAVFQHGQAGGVVAAVLQPAQPVQNDGGGGLAANVSDDSTHVSSLRAALARIACR